MENTWYNVLLMEIHGTMFCCVCRKKLTLHLFMLTCFITETWLLTWTMQVACAAEVTTFAEPSVV